MFLYSFEIFSENILDGYGSSRNANNFRTHFKRYILHCYMMFHFCYFSLKLIVNRTVGIISNKVLFVTSSCNFLLHLLMILNTIFSF